MARDITEKTQKVSEILQKGMTVDATTGINEIKPEAFDDALKAMDVTMDEVTKVSDARDHIYNGFQDACATVAIDTMKKHKKLQQVKTEQGFYKDVMSSTVLREQESPLGDGGTKTVKGAIKDSYRVNGAVKTRGDLKKIKQKARSLADEVL